MGVNKQFKRTLISAAIALGVIATGVASAKDWIMIQGTEKKNAGVPAKTFGFLQFSYEEDKSDPNAAKQFNPPKLIGPNLNSQSGFNVKHAQLGVRGIAFPIDDRINYMLLVEGGNTALSQNGPVVTDASITASYIKGARVRAGLFKYPGSNEGMTSTTGFTFMNFTETTNQLLLERFPNTPSTTNASQAAPCTQLQLKTGCDLNKFDKPVGGFRDTGVMVFDNFELKNDWNMTYAVMVGQGSGIEQQNVDGFYDKYYYLALQNDSDEKMIGGLKAYIWSQSGKRAVDSTADGVANYNEFDRKRSGLGAHWDHKPFRAVFEYVKADGMIFEGPDKGNWTLTGNAANGTGYKAEASGLWFEGGYYIPKTNWEVALRMETFTRNKDQRDELLFKTNTLGVTYHFNPKSHFMINYAKRNWACNGPNATVCAAIDGNLKGVGDRIGLQLTTAL